MHTYELEFSDGVPSPFNGMNKVRAINYGHVLARLANTWQLRSITWEGLKKMGLKALYQITPKGRVRVYPSV